MLQYFGLGCLVLGTFMWIKRDLIASYMRSAPAPGALLAGGVARVTGVSVGLDGAVVGVVIGGIVLMWLATWLGTAGIENWIYWLVALGAFEAICAIKRADPAVRWTGRGIVAFALVLIPIWGWTKSGTIPFLTPEPVGCKPITSREVRSCTFQGDSSPWIVAATVPKGSSLRLCWDGPSVLRYERDTDNAGRVSVRFTKEVSGPVTASYSYRKSCEGPL